MPELLRERPLFFWDADMRRGNHVLAASLGLLANVLNPLAFRKKTGKLPARSHLEATGYVPEAPG